MANLFPFNVHTTQGPTERLWKCPSCEFLVLACERPEPCEDHPFDQMTEEEN